MKIKLIQGHMLEQGVQGLKKALPAEQRPAGRLGVSVNQNSVSFTLSMSPGFRGGPNLMLEQAKKIEED